MASEIRVNKIENRSGLGTVTFADTGVDLAGIVTATTFSGSGASLTALPAANITGTLPAISAANLTNVPAANITGTLPALSAANLTSIPAANVTGTLPALTAANLTNIPAANLVGVCTSGLTKTGGFGKILQVVSVVASSVVSSTAVGPVDTGLSASITPSATSSKVLVIVSQSMMTRLTGGGGWAVINYDLVRDSTVIMDGIDNMAIRASSHSPYILTASMVNLTYLDSPNTTSSTTYKTQAGRGNSGGSDMNWKAQDNDSPSTITLVEVAG